MHKQKAISFANNLDHIIHNQIQQKLKILIDLSTQSSSIKLKSFLKTIILSQQFYQWNILHALINSDEISRKPQFYNQTIKALSQLAYEQDQTIVMKIYLYGILHEKGMHCLVRGWNQQFKDLLQEGKLLMFHSWLTQTPDWNAISTIQTLNMLCKSFTLLVNIQKINIDEQYLHFIIHIICYIDLKKKQDFLNFDKFLNLIKRFRPNTLKNSNHQIQQEQHIVIKTLLFVLSDAKNSRGNVGWLFLPKFIQHKDIRTFFYYNSEQIQNFTENQLVNIFTKLFQNSLEQNALQFFNETTLLLKNLQKYYELKILYQKVTIPILIRRGKARMHLTQFLVEIGSFYVIGFYQHCDIGKNGLTCILSNINKVQDQNAQMKWIQLALLIAQKNEAEYQPLVLEQLQKQGIKKTQIDRISKQKGFQNFDAKTIWQISTRDSRKTKNYPKQKSKEFKGIDNHSLQCYIISVIQALSSTKQLPRILNEYKTYKRSELCYNLIQIFDNLISKHVFNVDVKRVKQYGPQYFNFSHNQEDAQQYLVKLFQKIQDELSMAKQRLLLEEFNKCFKSTIFRKLQCQNCPHIIQTTEQQYLHTISNRATLKQQQIQKLSDYICQKCNKKDFINKVQLKPTSTVFIVHINRFSYKNQKSCKQLATQNIKRSFLGYSLKGIIFHIGKNVQSGHYVYYYHVKGTKWVQMNDKNVYEFNLDQENQQFQLEMKSEMTPYILFYVKQDK